MSPTCMNSPNRQIRRKTEEDEFVSWRSCKGGRRQLRCFASLVRLPYIWGDAEMSCRLDCRYGNTSNFSHFKKVLYWPVTSRSWLLLVMRNLYSGQVITQSLWKLKETLLVLSEGFHWNIQKWRLGHRTGSYHADKDAAFYYSWKENDVSINPWYPWPMDLIKLQAYWK